MPYIQRNDATEIVGLYANLQPGFAEDFLVDDDPQVIAFLSPKPIASVSSRQFKLQLLAQGLLDQVDAWVQTQPRAIQVAYEYSGTFVRTAPMMADGFAAMGFTDPQIDDFFTAASKL